MHAATLQIKLCFKLALKMCASAVFIQKFNLIALKPHLYYSTLLFILPAKSKIRNWNDYSAHS